MAGPPPLPQVPYPSWYKLAEKLTRHAKAIEAYEALGFKEIYLVPNMEYINQWDYRDIPYPKSPPEKGPPRTLQSGGCAPLALAMVDGALRGRHTTPEEVAKFAVDTGHSGKAGEHGSDTKGMLQEWAHKHDLDYKEYTSEEQRKNVNALRDDLKAGGIAVVSVGKGHFTNESHVIVINGYAKDADGKKEWYFVVDPGRRDQGVPGKRDLPTTDSEVMQNRSLAREAGQVRISGEQLKKEMNRFYVLSNKKQADGL